jgi:hypothetical protein
MTNEHNTPRIPGVYKGVLMGSDCANINLHDVDIVVKQHGVLNGLGTSTMCICFFDRKDKCLLEVQMFGCHSSAGAISEITIPTEAPREAPKEKPVDPHSEESLRKALNIPEGTPINHKETTVDV